ncbi:uncharacterized protein LOC128869807 [Anastrepha ludens]|uniref:uncharacterized protein LOC128869807 n=1 Tax=Anastrepha ludens TaxID=28586 RepID=UPI0023B00491|nr:uncharacterized protein LOC128869807 [Anastrepha ludens]
MSDKPSTSSHSSRRSVKNLNNIDLIGNTAHQITGAKLPCIKQVLQVMFHNMRFVGLTAKDSAKLTISAAVIFWQQARIPIINDDKCVKKLMKVYDQWKNIQRTVPDKRSNAQKQVAEQFTQNLDDLFDIAIGDALEKIRIEEDREFLKLQRQKGRPGCMVGVDMKLYGREKRTQERQEKEEARKRKREEEMARPSDVVNCDDEDAEMPFCETIDEENEPIDDDWEPEKVAGNATSAKKRGRKEFITARLAAALDNAKVSDGMAVHILIAAAEAFGIRAEELAINRSTIHRARLEHRLEDTKDVMARFPDNINTVGSLVVHWDGKLLQDLIGRLKVERIAVLVSYNGTSKFLGAPKIESSSGEHIAAAVHETLVKWNIAEYVQGKCFDTTSSNTGTEKGASVLLEKKLKRQLLDLSCRHHVYEILLSSVFEVKLSPSSAPEVLIFERFAKSWTSYDLDSFCSGLNEKMVLLQIDQVEQENIKKFCFDQLTKNQIRDDYKEFLELVLTFLGAGPFNFRTPGPTSNARWMAKAIYCLKIFLFRQQFQLTKREANGLRDICIFLIKLYIKPWCRCTNAIAAPLQDLNFVKAAVQYDQTDSAISKAVTKKLTHHLWYLSEELVALAFFDSDVSHEEKRQMVEKLQSKEPVVKLKNDFVSENTKKFFNRFGLSTTFLEFDPSTWETAFDYEEGWTFCQNLFVVNDTAERGIKFIKDFNRILTNDEEELQLVFQFVQSYREKFRSYKKSDLTL